MICIKKRFLLHSNRQLAENRHVMCVVEKAGFEPITLGTGVERATNCATAPVHDLYYKPRKNIPMSVEKIVCCLLSCRCVLAHSCGF